MTDTFPSCGHPKSPENSYPRTLPSGNVIVRCRACMLAYQEQLRLKRGHKPRPKLITATSIKETPCALAEIWK